MEMTIDFMNLVMEMTIDFMEFSYGNDNYFYAI